jgi:hypothetical protein
VRRPPVCTILAYVVPVAGYRIVDNHTKYLSQHVSGMGMEWHVFGAFYAGLLFLLLLSTGFSVAALRLREIGRYAVVPILVISTPILLLTGVGLVIEILKDSFH